MLSYSFLLYILREQKINYRIFFLFLFYYLDCFGWSDFFITTAQEWHSLWLQTHWFSWTFEWTLSSICDCLVEISWKQCLICCIFISNKFREIKIICIIMRWVVWLKFGILLAMSYVNNKLHRKNFCSWCICCHHPCLQSSKEYVLKCPSGIQFS